MPVGNRPAGTPFWGESRSVMVALDAAESPNLTNQLVTRGQATSGGVLVPELTVNGGDAFNVWITPWATYLEPEDTGVVIEWVVEVLSGTGTLRLREGTTTEDPYGISSMVTPAVDRGTRSATGVGTLTWPATMTVADFFPAGDPIFPEALIECEDGSVEIQQVKLRVWPASGPRGTLSDPHDDEPDGQYANVAFVYYGAGNDVSLQPDPETALDAARDLHETAYGTGPLDGSTYTVGPVTPDPLYIENKAAGTFTAAGASYLADVTADGVGGDVDWTGLVRSQTLKGYFWTDLVQPGPRFYPLDGEEYVDWIVHPNEVLDDPASRCLPTSAEAEVWWGELTVAAGTPGWAAAASWSLDITECERPGPTYLTTFTLPDLIGGSLYTAGGGADHVGGFTPPSSGRAFVAHLRHAEVLTMPYSGGPPDYDTDSRHTYLDITEPGQSFSRIRFHYLRPAYRTFIPDLGEPEPSPFDPLFGTLVSPNPNLAGDGTGADVTFVP